MPENLTAETLQEIAGFADTLLTKFAPPEFISGCQVMGTASINEYATNNGWIEALCGQHNQQRVRWKSGETIGTTNYIDVIHFPAYHLFEAWGIAGTAAISPPGVGWPFTNIYTVSTTNADADYASIQAAITAVPEFSTLLLDYEAYTENLTISKSLAIFSYERQLGGKTGTVKINGTITITGTPDLVYLQGLAISNQAAGAETTSLDVNCSSSGVSIVLDSCYIGNAAGTLRNGIKHQDRGSITLLNSTVSITGNAVNVSSTNASCWVNISGGYIAGSNQVFTGASANPKIYLFLPPQIPTFSSDFGGTLKGRYTNTTGDIFTLSTTGHGSGVWLYDVSTGLKVKYATLSAAVTAMAAGDTIYLSPGTYDLGATGATLSVSGAIVGVDPLNTIITCASSNSFTLRVTADNFRLENLTINHTGTGTIGAGVRWATNNLTIRNCILSNTGAATSNYVLDHQGGNTTTSRIIGCIINASGATANYGYINNTAAALCEIVNTRITAATADVYSGVAGTTVTLSLPRLLGGGITVFAGSIVGKYTNATGDIVFAGASVVTGIDKAKVSKLRESDDGADALTADASGYLSAVAQPLFSAYLSSPAANVTGDGTSYPVVFDTEVFDRNSNYNNSTGVFTAPVTGKYAFTFACLITGLAAGHTIANVLVVTSNRTYNGSYCNPVNVQGADGYAGLLISCVADMDASDTATFNITVATSTKTVDVHGASTLFTYVQGYLLP